MLSALRLSRVPALAFAAMGALWGQFAALVPQLKGGLMLGDAAFGAAIVFSALGLVTAMWLAPLAEARLGRLALPLAVSALAMAFLLPGQAGTWAQLAAAMTVMGLCSGLTDVVMNARVSMLEARAARSLMNLNHAVFSLAYAGGALVAGATREAGWPPDQTFLIGVTLALVATVGMWGRIPAEPDHGAPSLVVGFPTSTVVWGGAVVLVAFLAENACEGWSALHVERTLGGGAAEGALGPAMLGLTMAVGRLSGQAAAGRLREETLLMAGALLAAAGAAGAALAPAIWVAYLGFAALGLGVSVLAPLALALVGAARGGPRPHPRHQPHGGDRVHGVLFRARRHGPCVRTGRPALGLRRGGDPFVGGAAVAARDARHPVRQQPEPGIGRQVQRLAQRYGGRPTTPRARGRGARGAAPARPQARGRQPSAVSTPAVSAPASAGLSRGPESRSARKAQRPAHGERLGVGTEAEGGAPAAARSRLDGWPISGLRASGGTGVCQAERLRRTPLHDPPGPAGRRGGQTWSFWRQRWKSSSSKSTLRSSWSMLLQPHSAMDTSSSLWITDRAVSTPAWPIAPNP